MITRLDHYRHHGRVLSRIFIAIAIMALAGGCGLKSQPVPPQQVVPLAINDLRYELSEKGVSLAWSYPRKTVSGSDLAEITSFSLYRAVVPVDDYCPDCPIPFGAPITLPGGAVEQGKSREATYESSLLRPGHLYFFKVRAHVGWWAESADSNTVSFLWYTPPRAPQGLSSTAGDGVVNLQWQAVSVNLDGSPIKNVIKYQVYRSAGGAGFVALREPTTATAFSDHEVTNSTKYLYKIQTIGVYEQGSVGGSLSAEVAAVPVDRTAPAAPSGVGALGTANSAKVYWTPAAETDIKEYVIYRRLDGEQSWHELTRVNVPASLFSDQNPPAAACWDYAVSAVDTPGNESAKSAAAQVCR